MVLKSLVRGLVALVVVGIIVGGLALAAVAQSRSGAPVIGYAFLLPGVLVIPYGLLYVVQGYRVKGTSTDSVTAAVSDGGHVNVEGEAQAADRTLSAPFTGEECLGYAWEIEGRSETAEDGSAAWQTVRTGSAAVPFLLSDGSGAVYVRADHDACTLDISDDESEFDAEDLPERGRQFLDDERLDPDRDVLRYREWRLLAGETTYVSGVATDGYGRGEVPSEAGGVIGPAEGPTARVRRWLPGGGFSVADAPIEEAGQRLVNHGSKVVVGALAYMAIIWFFTLR